MRVGLCLIEQFGHEDYIEDDVGLDDDASNDDDDGRHEGGFERCQFE